MNEPLIALPPLLDVPPALLTDAGKGAHFEWIEADGEGGWAAGTAIAATTRRQHGLLVVTRPGAGHVVLLARLEETIVTADGQRLDLSSNFYPGAVHPEGHRTLAAFSLDPWPVWRYRPGTVELVRELFRSHRSRALILRYRYDGPPATLEIRPLFAGRPLHGLATANEFIRREAEASEGLVAFQPYDDMPAAVLTFMDGDWESAPTWYYSNCYPLDTESGDATREDLFSPGILRVPLRTGAATTVACGLRPARVGRVDRRLNDELSRRETIARCGRRLASGAPALSDLAARLALAADAFAPRASASPPATRFPSATADTRVLLMTLPWITLAAGSAEGAVGILRAIARQEEAGLLPTTFGTSANGPDARTAADLPLWFVEAVATFAERGLDVEPLLPTVSGILDAWIEGTSFGIRVSDDGLVTHGPADRPMTWMDAFAHDQPVTPRWGRAVDINALWHNALVRGARLTGNASRALRWTEHAEWCREGFGSFWWDDAGYLVDAIDAAGHDDRSLRPNQLLAVSLPEPAVTGVRARSVVEAIERTLLVPLGIRSLAPGTDGYMRSDGGPGRQHAGRHQGSAWAFWLGPFMAAYLRVHDGDTPARRRVEAWLDRSLDPLQEGVLGQPFERVRAEPPHTNEGAGAAASAVAGLIQALDALRSAHAARPAS